MKSTQPNTMGGEVFTGDMYNLIQFYCDEVETEISPHEAEERDDLYSLMEDVVNGKAPTY